MDKAGSIIFSFQAFSILVSSYDFTCKIVCSLVDLMKFATKWNVSLFSVTV